RPVGGERHILDARGDIAWDARRNYMLGPAGCIFGVMVGKGVTGCCDLAHVQGLVADDRAGEFAPWDITFDHDAVPEGPVPGPENPRRQRTCLAYDDHAEARPFVDGLDH